MYHSLNWAMVQGIVMKEVSEFEVKHNIFCIKYSFIIMFNSVLINQN